MFADTVASFCATCMQSEVTLEVCLAPYWSDVRDATVSASVLFHSLHPSVKELTFVSGLSLPFQPLRLIFCVQHAGTMWTSFEVMSSFKQESLAPEFKLTHHVVPKRLVWSSKLVWGLQL